MTSVSGWYTINTTEASEILLIRCIELMLKDQGYLISADPTIRILTQRLYGDYRTIAKTKEYREAEKHVKMFKNTGLGRALF